MDLLELPGIRTLRRLLFLFCIRGEWGNSTRTLLFLDLAEAVRLNTPLDQALELITQGHENVNLAFNQFISRPDQMVKRLAWYLLPWVRQGLSLSQAMARQGKAFSRQEILIVEMGEQSGFLPRALKRLADYRQTDMRLQQIKSHLMYPIQIGIMAIMLIGFILIFIIPKFQDMFNMLGGDTELPVPTRILVRASYLFVYRAYLPALGLILAYCLINPVVRSMTGIPLLFHLPIIKGLYRTVRDARWMAAFTLGLESGVAADRALEQAGAISGGALERRSREAASLIEKGCPIGEACIRCKVLDRWINHRLQLIDWRGHYIEGIRGIVEDADRRVTEHIKRVGQRIEVYSILIVGVIVAFTVIAIYLPIFYIPKVILAHM